MSYDPLNDVEDEPLSVTAEVLEALAEHRRSEKLELLPGVDTVAEKARLSMLV